MSGSGASCFALFETQDAAAEAGDELAAQNPGWTVKAVSLQAAV
jgi:4-diphosphocytidyl-2-C-methyl-D-erythritol kinase